MKTEHDRAEARANQWMSIYIRLKYTNEHGMLNCYTCDKYIKWRAPKWENGAENGHLIGRDRHATKYDERNCRPQCNECNEKKYGNKEEFGKRINIEAGYDIYTELKDLSRMNVKQNAGTLRAIAVAYRLKSKELPNYYLYKEPR